MASADAKRPSKTVADDTETSHDAPVWAQVEVSPDVSQLLSGAASGGVVGTADSKSIKFQKTLKSSDDGTPLAELGDVSVAVTRMILPATGLPFLNIYLSYYVTSDGWRTGSGPGEDQRPLHGLYFRNEAFGTMYSWGFPYQDFEVECGWNRVFRLYHWTESNFVSWFDEWRHIHYGVNGNFYQC